jgi:phosphoribosyl 1,2-cyclic phosphodiesterase
MPIRFTVLASGSEGNASLLEVDGFGLLLDAGLGPRQLAQRLALVGATWNHVHATLLTHTHGDHWNDRTLAYLHRRRIPLYCYPDHHEPLLNYGEGFAKLHTGDLVRPYEIDAELLLGPKIRCRPLPLRHDGGATFGFRFEASTESPEPGWAIGYVADLGSWTMDLARALADVDILALEFNHDVEMEYASGRSPQWIARVLGNHGHLSNEQAAALLRAVLRLSAAGRLRYVVQLHLSRECNHSTLALRAARKAVDGAGASIQIHTACQRMPGPALSLQACLENGLNSKAEVLQQLPSISLDTTSLRQRWLPGWED